MRPISSIVPKKGADRWLYETLRHLQQAATQSQSGLNAVVRNEVPDGSGDPIVDPALFFYKPGLAGGQLAHGGIGGSENLTLSSTAATAKGKIFLGSAQGSAFDEANGFLGLGTGSPTGRLHLLPDSNAVYTKYEATTFTVVNCSASSGSPQLSTTASFAPVGGPRVVPGMLVTATGIPVNTYVKRLDSGTILQLTANTNGVVSGDVVFSAQSQFELVNDETGGKDITWRNRGGLRFVSGPPDSLSTDVPVRLYGDRRALAANASESPQLYLETGYISSGNAVGANLRLGGPGGGELNFLNLRARFMFFDRNPSSGTSTCIGINQNPLEFGTSGPATVASLMIAVNPLRVLSTEIAMHGATAGTSPAKTIGEKIWSIETDTNMGWWTGSAGSEVRSFYMGRVSTNSGGGARESWRLVNQQANPSGGTFANNNLFVVTPALEWATADVSPTFTTRLDFGDSGRGILSGFQGAKMSRFGIVSDFVTIASATSRTIPLGLALLHLELTGTTATVGQIIRASGAQSADYFQIRDSSNTVIYTVTSGIKVGINTSTPTNDLSFGGEAARKLWMEKRTAANVAGNNLTIQSGGATVAATNKAGGTLILMTGDSTGSAGGTINLQTPTPGTAGTGTNTPSTKFSIGGSGAITHTQLSFAPSGMSQNFTISSGISATQYNGNTWTHTLSNVVDSFIYGLQMQLQVTTDSTDSGGSGIQGFGFEIFENGESTTGASTSAIGGFIRHSSAATGLTFTGVSIDIQTAGGAGASNLVLYTAGSSNLSANVTSWIGYQVTDPTNSATLTDLYGIYIHALTAGVNNWAIFSAGGQSAHAGKLALGSTTTPAEMLDLYGNIKLALAAGTKIGTATSQKLSFWNATPIVQPTTAVTAATFVANTSGIVNDTATFDGYTIGQVVKALRNMGLLA